MKNITKQTTLFICLGIITLLSLAVLSCFLYPLTQKKIRYTDFHDCNIAEDRDCKYLFELDNKKTVLVTIGKEKVSDSLAQKEEKYRQYIKLGDTRIWEGSVGFAGGASMRVWGDLIVAHYVQGYGCGDLGEVVAYNSDVEEVIHYGSDVFQQNVDNNNPTLSYYNIKIDNEKKEIEIEADNFGGCAGGLKVPTTQDSYEWITNPCDKIEIEKYDIPDDYVVKARYLIKYQEDGSFSKPIQISKETFKEILQNCEEVE